MNLALKHTDLVMATEASKASQSEQKIKIKTRSNSETLSWRSRSQLSNKTNLPLLRCIRKLFFKLSASGNDLKILQQRRNCR